MIGPWPGNTDRRLEPAQRPERRDPLERVAVPGVGHRRDDEIAGGDDALACKVHQRVAGRVAAAEVDDARFAPAEVDGELALEGHGRRGVFELRQLGARLGAEAAVVARAVGVHEPARLDVGDDLDAGERLAVLGVAVVVVVVPVAVHQPPHRPRA
jgi:hypothetical protein